MIRSFKTEDVIVLPKFYTNYTRYIQVVDEQRRQQPPGHNVHKYFFFFNFFYFCHCDYIHNTDTNKHYLLTYKYVNVP